MILTDTTSSNFANALIEKLANIVTSENTTTIAILSFQIHSLYQVKFTNFE